MLGPILHRQPADLAVSAHVRVAQVVLRHYIQLNEANELEHFAGHTHTETGRQYWASLCSQSRRAISSLHLPSIRITRFGPDENCPKFSGRRPLRRSLSAFGERPQSPSWGAQRRWRRGQSAGAERAPSSERASDLLGDLDSAGTLAKPTLSSGRPICKRGPVWPPPSSFARRALSPVSSVARSPGAHYNCRLSFAAATQSAAESLR